MMTKLFVNGSFWGLPLFIPLLRMNKWGLLYRVSLRWVLMIKLVIALELKWVNFPIFRRSSVEKPMYFATLRPLNFSKEKKGKKKAIRLSGRFQKSKFF
jgi:hypothetical protein